MLQRFIFTTVAFFLFGAGCARPFVKTEHVQENTSTSAAPAPVMAPVKPQTFARQSVRKTLGPDGGVVLFKTKPVTLTLIAEAKRLRAPLPITLESIPATSGETGVKITIDPSTPTLPAPLTLVFDTTSGKITQDFLTARKFWHRCDPQGPRFSAPACAQERKVLASEITHPRFQITHRNAQGVTTPLLTLPTGFDELAAAVISEPGVYMLQSKKANLNFSPKTKDLPWSWLAQYQATRQQDASALQKLTPAILGHAKAAAGVKTFTTETLETAIVLRRLSKLGMPEADQAQRVMADTLWKQLQAGKAGTLGQGRLVALETLAHLTSGIFTISVAPSKTATTAPDLSTTAAVEIAATLANPEVSTGEALEAAALAQGLGLPGAEATLDRALEIARAELENQLSAAESAEEVLAVAALAQYLGLEDLAARALADVQALVSENGPADPLQNQSACELAKTFTPEVLDWQETVGRQAGVVFCP